MSGKIITQEKLIECVRGYETLYNTDMKEYTDAVYKEKLWQNISKECGMASAGAAKTAWKNLRDGYRLALRNLNSNRSGNKAKKTKSWKFLEQMHFLRPYMKNRTRCCNLKDKEDPQLLEESLLEEFQVTDDVNLKDGLNAGEKNYDVSEKWNNENNSNSSVQSECSSGQERAELPIKVAGVKRKLHASTAKKKRQRTITEKNEQLEFFQEQTKKREEKYRENQQTHQNILQPSEDSLKLFFDSMYVTTKKFPLALQRQVKSQLFQAVCEAEVAADMNNLVEINRPPNSSLNNCSEIMYVSSGPSSSGSMDQHPSSNIYND